MKMRVSTVFTRAFSEVAFSSAEVDTVAQVRTETDYEDGCLAVYEVPKDSVFIPTSVFFWGMRVGYVRALLPPDEVPIRFSWRMSDGRRWPFPVVVSDEIDPRRTPKVEKHWAIEGPVSLIAEYKVLKKKFRVDSIGVSIEGELIENEKEAAA